MKNVDDGGGDDRFKDERAIILGVFETVKSNEERRIKEGLSVLSFSWGVLNCLLIAYVFGAYPQHFFLLYLVEGVLMLRSKMIEDYVARPYNQIFYYIDYCWAMNMGLLGVISLVFFYPALLTSEQRENIYMGVVGVCCGPLLGATALLPFVAVVFHSNYMMTGLFIHITPPMFVYTLLWHGTAIRAAWSNIRVEIQQDTSIHDQPFFPTTASGSANPFFVPVIQGYGTIAGNAMIAYSCWFVPYTIYMLVWGIDLTRKHRRSYDRVTGRPYPPVYDTVFHSNARFGFAYFAGAVFKRPKHITDRQVAENDFERRDLVLYMAIHVVLVYLATILIAYYTSKYKQIHAAVLWVLTVLVVYRGANRYVYWITSMSSRSLEKQYPQFLRASIVAAKQMKRADIIIEEECEDDDEDKGSDTDNNKTTTATTASKNDSHEDDKDTTAHIRQRRQSTRIAAKEYREQTCDSLPSYLMNHAPDAIERLGTISVTDIDCVEMGDGNMNLVFLVTNKLTPTQNQLIVKQAVPYVRCVGEGWPLSIDRSYYEYKALLIQKQACTDQNHYVPEVYHFSRADGLIVMEYLPPPIMIVRKGLVAGIRFPETLATDMGTFCAHTLFLTSGLHLDPTSLRGEVEFWSANKAMCALSEQVIFTEPYIVADNNRWTSPQLDQDKKLIEHDVELKLAANRLYAKFVCETQALIHGDLHTGSVMCCPERRGQTYVIDPEFAFYGPMGFDLGAFIGNLFLSYVSQPSRTDGDDATKYQEWLLDQIKSFWSCFAQQFIQLWNDPKQHTGFVYMRKKFESKDIIKRSQDAFMREILADTLGFAGMKMIRRIVGIAHVEDLDSITDVETRATRERHGLTIAKHFVKNAASIQSIDEAIQLARDFA